MQRNVTALYRTHAAAELVERELKDLGYSMMSITMIPNSHDHHEPGYDYSEEMNDLHDLHLPEDDTRTYQNAVRRGDHVVSVNVEDDDYLTRVKDIMRNPEAKAYDLDHADTEFATADYYPYQGDRAAANEGWMGTRDAEYKDSVTRVYGRREPLPYT